jgi:hypothetical protein
MAMMNITRNAIMAGYDPTGVNQGSIPANKFSGVTCNPEQIQIKMDSNGDGIIGSGEDIVYQYDSANERINRTAGGQTISLPGRMQAFTFAYLDANGNTTTDNSTVRTIRLTITGKTDLPDPSYKSNNGYRTFTLTSDISPRNLAIN